jgi:hypothetical protein
LAQPGSMTPSTRKPADSSVSFPNSCSSATRGRDEHA